MHSEQVATHEQTAKRRRDDDDDAEGSPSPPVAAAGAAAAAKKSRTNSKPLTVLSLFSGAGGMDLGFQQAGFKLLYAVEMDKTCCETYRANVDPCIQQADVQSVDFDTLPRADVIIGGML